MKVFFVSERISFSYERRWLKILIRSACRGALCYTLGVNVVRLR